MSSRRTLPVRGPAMLACCLLVLCAALTLPFARSAQASYYRMVLCAAGNGTASPNTATNTSSAGNPGIFSFQTGCGAAPYPAGNNAYMRINEVISSGSAGFENWGIVFWDAPPNVSIAAAGGYTREPNAFNEGWRAFFYGEGYDGSRNNILVQGAGVANGSCGGVCWATTSTFASHLWPFGGFGNYRRFVFEMKCVRANGCDSSNFNAVDANSLQLVLNDTSAPQIGFTGSAGIMGGQWVRGTQPVTWQVAEEGSGLRLERLRVDGNQRYVLDHGGACKLGTNAATGEFALIFRPCPTTTAVGHSTTLDTATLPDGPHAMSVCAQDYGQFVGLNGSGGESCDQRQIKTDNTAPGAPLGLAIDSAKPARYMQHFGAEWTLPADPGSPISKVHYDVVDAAGKTVVAEKTLVATNPTQLQDIAGPQEPGEYRLRVWLEDAVGLFGPAASVAIPHDTTPPAAPQDLSVTSPSTARSVDGFDVRWWNLPDGGAPIDAAHYEVLDGAGNVVVSQRDLRGENPQSIPSLETPSGSGGYSLRLWLSDAEGNVGAASTAPLAYRCERSSAAGGNSLTAGVGEGGEGSIVLAQGKGTTLGGALRGPGGPVSGAALCVFSAVITDTDREFLGVAMSGPGGEYRFPIPAGPSRQLVAMYRGDHREIEAKATALTRVRPTFKVQKRLVRNKHAAVFSGQIPGPHNDRVVVVLQVRSGKGWRAFRRYRTRADGRYKVRYRFTQTRTPTLYKMRAQVRETTGYPYLQGNSAPLKLRVMP
jgi:hypothetical protein